MSGSHGNYPKQSKQMDVVLEMLGKIACVDAKKDITKISYFIG